MLITEIISLFYTVYSANEDLLYGAEAPRPLKEEGFLVSSSVIAGSSLSLSLPLQGMFGTTISTFFMRSYQLVTT